MTSFTSGDAKWAFAAVPVTAGSQYFYRDFYKSSTTTKLVAAFTQSDGSMAYKALGIAPEAADWNTIAYAFTVPAGATSATVYHLIAGVGSLQIDDVRLALPQAPDLVSGVPNGSMEQTADLDVSKPLAWATSAWGTNQADFARVSLGDPDNHALSVTLRSYSSGDAKWVFDPQPVKAGTRYLYSDSYLADAETFITARFTMSDGTFRYLSLGDAAPASTLGRAQFAFQAPLGSVAATVFHGLATTGVLQLDNAALTTLPSEAVTNGVPNAGLERPAFPEASVPAAWSTNAWGTNGALFSYASDGHSGLHSVRVDMPTYTNGRAAWYVDPLVLNPAMTYRFTDFYRSDVDTAPMALVTLTDGSTVNLQLPVAFASLSWTQYAADLCLPAKTATVTIHHQLTRVGFLQTDDYSVLPANNQPFSRGLVSLTFDDSWLTDYSHALPVLNRHHAVATHYALTGSLGQPDRMSVAMLRDLEANGHQVAGHTVTHRDLTTLSPADVLSELADSKLTLEQNGLGTVADFASPFGAYNQSIIVSARSLYQSHRTVDAGYNTKTGFDPLRLRAQSMRSTTTIEEVNSWAAQAAADHSWLIIVYHDVTPTSGSIYSTTPEELDRQLFAIESNGLPMVTVRQALDEIVPQLTAP